MSHLRWWTSSDFSIRHMSLTMQNTQGSQRIRSVRWREMPWEPSRATFSIGLHHVRVALQTVTPTALPRCCVLLSIRGQALGSKPPPSKPPSKLRRQASKSKSKLKTHSHLPLLTGSPPHIRNQNLQGSPKTHLPCAQYANDQYLGKILCRMIRNAGLPRSRYADRPRQLPYGRSGNRGCSPRRYPRPC